MARILVVDDQELVRATLRAVLEREGHEVIDAENGLIALQIFERQPTDLVITDIIMPDMEGLGTIRELRKEHPDLKIIAISGGGRMGNIEFLEAAKKLGAHETVKKPLNRSELVRAVARCLG